MSNPRTLVMAQDERGTWFWPRVLEFRLSPDGRFTFVTSDQLRDHLGRSHDRTT